MFAKDNISLSFSLERVDLFPGESTPCTLEVRVSKEIECTAIRIALIGSLRTRVRVQQSAQSVSTVTYKEEDILGEHIVTCFGFAPSSGRKGGCYLYPGTDYTYACSMQVPSDTIGTLVGNMGDAKVSVYWRVKAYVDIAHGFDKSETVDLYVRTPAPSVQIWNPRPAQPVDLQVASCGCTGCYCCATGETVRATVAMSPGVLLTCCDTYSNGQSANAVHFSIEVVNNSALRDITEARVKVVQYLTAHANGHAKTRSRTVATATLSPVPRNGWTVGEYDYGNVLDGLDEEEFGTFAGTVCVEPKYLIPTVSHQLFSVMHHLEIDFPHSPIKEFVFKTLFAVATGEDVTNSAARLPCMIQSRDAPWEESL